MHFSFFTKVKMKFISDFFYIIGGTLEKTMKKSKRKEVRKNRVRFNKIFNDCTFTTDCLRLILSSSLFSTEDLISVNHVSKSWRMIIKDVWRELKDVRIVFKSYNLRGSYTSCICKGYIQLKEHPIDMYDYSKYSVSYWTRRIYVSHEKLTPLIYDMINEKTFDIWISP